MNLLVFDTVLNKTFITLAKGGTGAQVALSTPQAQEVQFFNKVIESDAQNYHSVYLISEIKNLLAEHCIEMNELGAIGVNIGPGSFTGIRVCLSVANVMAGQLALPLIGVPSVEILSKAFEGAAVFLDARRGSYIYFDSKNEASLINKADALSLARGKKVVADANCAEYFAQNSIEVVNYETENYNLGEILAKITMEKLAQNVDAGANDSCFSCAKPLYLQTPPVMIK